MQIQSYTHKQELWEEREENKANQETAKKRVREKTSTQASGRADGWAKSDIWVYVYVLWLMEKKRKRRKSNNGVIKK